MPRSFMITHKRRFENGDPSGICGSPSSNLINTTSSNNSSGSGTDDNGSSCDLSDVRMQPESPVRELSRSYVTSVPDSPEFKKRVIYSHRGLDKCVSVSDGESDSGSSIHTDARHELPPELEYSWDCPSGFSLLLELMTQSPQRFSGRDVVDLSSDVRSPGQRLVKEDFEKARIDIDLDDAKRLDNQAGVLRFVEKVEDSNMHIHLLPEDEAVFKAVDDRKYIFETPGIRKGFKDFPEFSSNGIVSLSTEQTQGLDLSNNGDLQTHAISSPNYDFANLNDQGAKVYQAQRKISFPEEHEEMQNFKSMKRPESPNDQPIDYSQLSSRRKETNDDKRKGNPHYAVNGQETGHTRGIQKSEARLMSGTVTGDTRNSSTKNTVLTPKYDFILSPKMDGNGNIIIPQSPQSSCKPPLSSQVQNFKVGRDAYQPPASFSYHESNPAGSYKQQSSPLYGSPASPKFGSTDPKQESIINLAKAKFEATSYDQDKTGISKPQVPYHPKLKYLLAASKFAKAKDQQNTGVSATAEAAAASISPSHQSHQSMLFSHDQAALADTQPKLNEQQQNVFSRSEADHVHGIPPNEIFHAINSTPNYKFHNSNVFVLNAMSSFKPNTSSTDISTGSPLNEKQQHRHIDIRHSQLNSSSSSTSPSAMSHIPEMFNESRTTDQYPCDKVHTTPLSMSPSSPSQPLSPASLRDQQSALSELLFSSTRKSGIDPYACADCGKRYSTSSNLARHRQTHRSVCDKKARKCPHCDKVYVSMPAYSMHVRTHNQGCECPHCGKKFSRPWLLQGHIRTHTGEKPFGCPQCGKSFADKSNLRAHIQTHSTEKPYVCGRCGKAFALKSYLYKHEESSCMRGQRFRR